MLQPQTHSARTRRSANHDKEFTLEDVRHRMDGQDALIAAIRGDTQIQAQALQSQAQIMQGFKEAMGQMAKDVATIALAIGEEKEDGAGNYLGTGLLGRTRRVERAQRSLRELYHRWIAFGSGFVACGGVLGAALWWLLSDKLALVLKGTGHG